MKKILTISALVLLGGYFALFERAPTPTTPRPSSAIEVDSDAALAAAYEAKQSDLQVRGAGHVTRVLPDDTDGSRHQRFIIELASGQTLLVAHNIDLAPRIPKLSTGDWIEFYGEYEWNPEGGVIHWTHHDPEGRHIGGWLKRNGRTYH